MDARKHSKPRVGAGEGERRGQVTGAEPAWAWTLRQVRAPGAGSRAARAPPRLPLLGTVDQRLLEREESEGVQSSAEPQLWGLTAWI